MQDKNKGISAKVLRSGWSNRIFFSRRQESCFLPSIRFASTFMRRARRRFSFPFGQKHEVGWHFVDVFLNVLLFVPFGFALAAKLRERGNSRAFTLALALATGALFSYTIEFLQLYIPPRDSGWEDIFTNTSGSVAAFFSVRITRKTLLQGLDDRSREPGSNPCSRRGAPSLFC